MASKVWLVRTEENEKAESLRQKIRFLYERAEMTGCFPQGNLVAVKLHFGERGNVTHIPPDLVRAVVDEIKKGGAKPFLTDTCVLYKSQRDNAVNHLLLADEHGFTVENTGAPVLIADGLLGSAEKEVDIPGSIYKKVSLSAVALEANGVMVLTHVTGHMGIGMGGTIKNLGMGFASRKGKLRQHSVMKPAVSSKSCTGCGVCISWCPADAIVMEGEIAVIDSKKCIGCGECLAFCRFDAVKYDWRVGSNDLQKRIAEHALGVVIGKTGKAAYMNFLMSVTKDCDCMGGRQISIIPDIGILASKDPVAVDAASLGLIRDESGKELTELSYPHLDAYVQIRHGEAIGLGSSKYELVEVA